MAAAQSALYVPPGYEIVNATGVACTDGKFHCSAEAWCGASNCSAGLAAWAAETVRWARTEPRVIGLAPYYYACDAAGVGWMKGSGCAPRVRAAWQAIGQGIVAQADGGSNNTGLHENHEV